MKTRTLDEVIAQQFALCDRLEAGTVDLAVADRITNSAGKIIAGFRTKLAYKSMRAQGQCEPDPTLEDGLALAAPVRDESLVQASATQPI